MSKAAALRGKFFTPNVALLIFFMVGAAVFSHFRFFHGFGSVTNLNPSYPMGMWIAFDVACGVALAAGGFSTSTSPPIPRLVGSFNSYAKPSPTRRAIGI